MTQLRLDSYEYGKFQQYGGIASKLVNGLAPMCTALHGWACQLIPCPCGCRKFPLSESRLAENGLFGALIHCPGCMNTCDGQVQNIRHLHPWEIALLSGIVPNKCWGPNLRFSIAALGQMATPIQSLWVVSQFKRHLLECLFDAPAPTPEETLWIHVGDIMKVFESGFPVGFHHEAVQNFIDRTHRCLFSHAAKDVLPSHLPNFGKSKPHPNNVDLPLLSGNRGDSCIAPGTSRSIKGLPETDEDWKCNYPECPVCVLESELPPLQSLLGSDVSIAEPQCDQKAPSHQVGENLHNDCFPHGFKTDHCVSPTLHFSLQIADEPKPIEADLPRVPQISSCGGIPGFKSKKRSADTFIESRPKKPLAVPDSPPIPTIAGPSMQPLPDSPEVSSPKGSSDLHGHHSAVIPQVISVPTCNVLVFRHPIDSCTPQVLKVKKGSSVGELHCAEDRLGSFSLHSKVCDSVGAFVSDTCIIDSDVTLHFHLLQHETHPPKCPILPDTIVDGLDFRTLTRSDILQLQQGWVAKDEMDFYLETGIDLSFVKAFPSFSLPEVWEFPEADKFIQWLIDGIKLGPDSLFAASTLLWKHHWVPLVFVHAGIGVTVHTSPEGHSIVEALLSKASMSSPISSIMVRPVVNVFPADCGFQCIGWIRAITASGISEGTWNFSPVTSKDAASWRESFQEHLLTTHGGQNLVHPSLFQVGGAHDEIENGLVDLLEKHGVPSDASSTRASQVVEKLGRTTVSKVLRSQNAWKDLKSCANNLVPKLQLVLTSEMEASIKARAASSQPFGDRQNKKQTKGKKPNSSFFKLRAEDVVIPEGIFKEGSDVAIKQIGLNEIGPTARGVVVVNATQAYPYVKVHQPLSQCGLALLILEHRDPAFSGLGETIRFPAKCDATDEPMIISARLVQLGSAAVSRHFPVQQLKVEESANLVLRILTFRDEWESDWISFCNHPVKSILAELPDLQDTPGQDSRILDVFDRQWLSLHG